MSLNVLTLPLDIPWKRLCVSADMNDGALCDTEMPPRWRSSIAIFGYEPPPEDQTFDDMVVSYVKVTCSITGYQIGREVQLEREAGIPWKKKRVYTDYANQVSRYYPCHGALLQIAVGHRATSGLNIAGYRDPNGGPYIADFEPKKRELYELVTETGETMSRSLEAAKVRKGATTTDSHEVVDSMDQSLQYDSAGAQSGNIPVGGGSWKGSVGLGNKTRDLSQEEISDVRTSDQGREMRETYSHTTQLTQMYHQLNSYHVGTNRAMFFLLPRPHVQESPKTFVNGPREIEGIQEFFLVVMRPKGMENVCLEAYLETAHIAHEPTMGPKETRSVNWKFMKLSATVEDRDSWYDTDDDSYEHTEQRPDTYTPPAGWVIDGYTAVPTTVGDATYTVDWKPNYLTATGKAVARYVDNYGNNIIRPASIEIDFVIDISTIEEKEVSATDVLFMTGRGLCCCPGEEAGSDHRLMRDSVTFEKQLSLDSPRRDGSRFDRRDDGSMPIAQANRMRVMIGKEVMSGLNSVDRYPRGAVTLEETQFASRTVARALGRKHHPDNQPVREIRGLDPDVAGRLAERLPRLTRAHLLRASIRELTREFGLSREQALHARRAALGLRIESAQPPHGHRS